MASNKINRINEDIQFVLSGLIRSIKDPRVNKWGLISVTRVDTTGDLRYCKVWISILGEVDEREFKRGIKSASGWLRRELGSRLSLRIVPELSFELDDSIQQGAYINTIINGLDIAPEEPDEKDE